MELFVNGTLTVTDESGADVSLVGDTITVEGTSHALITAAQSTTVNAITSTGSGQIITGTERTKLNGIAAGAEVNVQSDWDQTDTTADDYIENKPTIPNAANNATITITPGNGIAGGGDFTTDQSSDEMITISHADTSTFTPATATGQQVVRDFDIDGFGHITNKRFVNLPDGTITLFRFTATVTNNISNTTLSVTGADSVMTADNVSTIIISGVEGQDYNVSISVVPDSDYEFVTGPTPSSPQTFSGTLSSDISESITFEGTTRLQRHLTDFQIDGGPTFNQFGEVVNWTISGDSGTNVNISIINDNPTGWIQSGALNPSSGTIGSNGTLTGTVTIPSVHETVNRTFALRAISTSNPDDVVSSSTIRQMHTEGQGSGGDGDLRAGFNSVITDANITFSVNITAGDAPYSVTLATSGENPPPLSSVVETMTIANNGIVTFTAIDAGTLLPGEHTYFAHISETGGDSDILIESETINIPQIRIIDSGLNGMRVVRNSSQVFSVPLDGFALDDLALYIRDVRFDTDNHNNDHSQSPRVYFFASQSSFENIPSGDNVPYRIVNISESPEVILETGTINIVDNVPESISDVTIGNAWIDLSTSVGIRFSFGRTLFDVTNSVGVDYLEGSHETVPDGSNRLITTNADNVNRLVSRSYAQSRISSQRPRPYTYTVRPWVYDGVTRVFGPTTVVNVTNETDVEITRPSNVQANSATLVGYRFGVGNTVETFIWGEGSLSQQQLIDSGTEASASLAATIFPVRIEGNITGLSPSTQYSYMLRFTESEGGNIRTFYTDIRRFTTLS